MSAKRSRSFGALFTVVSRAGRISVTTTINEMTHAGGSQIGWRMLYALEQKNTLAEWYIGFFSLAKSCRGRNPARSTNSKRDELLKSSAVSCATAFLESFNIILCDDPRNKQSAHEAGTSKTSPHAYLNNSIDALLRGPDEINRRDVRHGLTALVKVFNHCDIKSL
eukprot:1189763-Prorocentrum_minimum.AAC.4